MSAAENIAENVLLAPYTTLRVGGPARWFVEAASDDEMLAAVRLARAQGVPWFVLGGGSNLLVSDEGFPGVVIRTVGSGAVWCDAGDGLAAITAGAGDSWESVVDLAMEHNCAGVECLAGIPGSVGGTPVQNVGAYGQEVSRSIASVRAIDLGAEKAVVLTPAECGFSYRRSIFNSSEQGRYAITGVTYRLRVDGAPHLEYRDVKNYFAERDVAAPSLAETAAAVRAIRARKGMLLDEADPDSRSAGSFFKNPVVRGERVAALAALAQCAAEGVPQFPAGAGFAPTDEMVKLSAAWLIELAGFHKGFILGAAGLSARHVLAIVNRGGASAAEIVALRDAIIGAVEGRTGIRLEQEPVMVGFPPLG